jgi:hypothetical protein
MVYSIPGRTKQHQSVISTFRDPLAMALLSPTKPHEGQWIFMFPPFLKKKWPFRIKLFTPVDNYFVTAFSD